MDYKPEPANDNTMSVRREILEKAIQCVCQDRNAQYGDPEDSFRTIAELWSAYIGLEYSAGDVGIMLALMKIGRIACGKYKDDSYIDAAGYIACAAQCEKGSTK